MAKRKTAAKPKSTARKSARSASRKTKSSTKKPKSSAKKTKTPAKAKKSSPGAAEVTVDRRRTARRKNEDQCNAASESSVPPTRLERRKKVNRRRQIDPTTCERDYTDDEIQFMKALDDYKHTSGRMFPTCSEVLEVVRSLGYVQLSPGDPASQPAAESTDPVPEFAVATPPAEFDAALVEQL